MTLALETIEGANQIIGSEDVHRGTGSGTCVATGKIACQLLCFILRAATKLRQVQVFLNS